VFSTQGLKFRLLQKEEEEQSKGVGLIVANDDYDQLKKLSEHTFHNKEQKKKKKSASKEKKILGYIFWAPKKFPFLESNV